MLPSRCNFRYYLVVSVARERETQVMIVVNFNKLFPAHVHSVYRLPVLERDTFITGSVNDQQRRGDPGQAIAK